MSRLFIALFACATFSIVSAAELLPIRGIHFSAPPRDQLELCLKFIREALPKEGVNTLVLEINYGYRYKNHPELASSNALGEEDIKSILQACRDADIELIPQFNCLGHQSWAKQTFSLLTQYPEFDETPGKYPNNEDIYCRSYCPLHPKVHEVIFALLDELAEAFEAKAFHVGMDEVFLLADPDCPRCQGKNPADLFAGEVNKLHDFFAAKGITMWMWGDRFLDGETTGLGEWEGSTNDTMPALHQIPQDIVICDWHYDRAEPTAIYFATLGFPVLSCPWRKPEVALGQLELIQHVRKNASSKIAERMQGMLHTTWCGMVPFIRAYYGEDSSRNKSAIESAETFKRLFAEMRKE